MFARTFRVECFLRAVYGTQPFIDYCRQRAIAFAQVPAAPLGRDDIQRWTAATAQLSPEQQGQIAWELGQVNEMADPASVPHFLDAHAGQPPPPDSIPGGAPLALWFFLNHSDVFQQVFLHADIYEIDPWHQARAPAGLILDNLREKAARLATGLQGFFQRREGSGRFCTVDAYRLMEAICFTAFVADRVQLVDGFTDSGELITQPVRPAFAVTFLYYADGTLLLKSRLRATDRLLELFQHFGRAVLGVQLPASCLKTAFDLDRLKQDFAPLPDGEDMQGIFLRAIQFRYPERSGRREVRLRALADDARSALGELLQAHLPAEILDQLAVSSVELQILMGSQGSGRSYFVRLEPNCCNLNPSPMGERLRACLKRWGLVHV